ncbi:MAG: four-carbon acid sugar kinase family protein [Lachnospiraceae bacterium]|nr:four-carbon acid sugar kinase family protein [Lachnospiraceae bacterium]
MVQLFMMADDLTGALDTGVHFQMAGLPVKVIVDREYSFPSDETASVVIVDTETRHLPAHAAYRIVYLLTRRACEAGIPYIYKKTDSALRGNPGSELAAVLDASGEMFLPFFPSYPRMRRITRGGVQFIGDVPLAKSGYASDPRNPMHTSYVPDILRQQCELQVEAFNYVRLQEEGIGRKKGVLVFDAENTEEMEANVRLMQQENVLHLMGGCAGLAEILPELLFSCERDRTQKKIPNRTGMTVVCGSMNPVSKAQLDYAQNHGFGRLHLPGKALLDPCFWDLEEGGELLDEILLQRNRYRCHIIDTMADTGMEGMWKLAQNGGLKQDEVPGRIVRSLSELARRLAMLPSDKALMIIGGDTLQGFLNQIGVTQITPIYEVEMATVLFETMLDGRQEMMLTKSGGFGDETLLPRLAERVLQEENT